MIRQALAAIAVMGTLVTPAAGGAASTAASRPIVVEAAPGRVAAVVSALESTGVAVQRRSGRRLQVAIPVGRLKTMTNLPGVVGARPAASAFADASPVTTQGLLRTGAGSLLTSAAGGRGLVIAVLDLGFGPGVAARQAAGELAPPERTESQSFDATWGFAGRNAYGNATNHGELVAQTVFDYAPEATYLLVNYHTPDDYLAAVEWLIARRPDMVVHSNSFLEGPFDGTSPAAQAVDRAAAAGILWVNSAGNYARRHWEGPWLDADANSVLDWPVPDSGVYYRPAGQPMTFALSWIQPPGAVRTDLDLFIERRDDLGAWVPVASSEDRQPLGPAPAERITGYVSPVDGYFRVRVAHISGPVPSGNLTIFSREIDTALLGGTTASSIPTPGDAAGSLTVGAADWRGDRLKTYSSIGPTDDGRLKPDLVAPTDTSVAGPNGPRGVGGTSNAAPNAAGAAAVVLAERRATGQPAAPLDVRGVLATSALDLGDPGPDATFGAGRVRVELTPPQITAVSPAPQAAVGGRIRIGYTPEDASLVARSSVIIGGQPLGETRVAGEVSRGFDTRGLPDGWHLIGVDAVDWPGNIGRREWSVRVDNTPPILQLLAVKLARRRISVPRDRPRAARMAIALADVGTGRMRLEVRVGNSFRRTLTVGTSRRRTVTLGRRAPGRARVRLTLTDRAGNIRNVSRVVVFR